MVQFIDSIRDVKANWANCDAWEQKEADDLAKRKYLAKTLDLPKDKVEITREKAKAVFRASDLMDKRSEDNCANMEQANQFGFVAATMPLGIALGLVPMAIEKKQGKPLTIMQNVKMQTAFLPPILALGVAYEIWSSSKQKEASRLGRFHAKQNELKDVKNFVLYSPEQIETAQKLAEKMPDKDDKKPFSQVLSELKEMSKDKDAYKTWLEGLGLKNEEIKNAIDNKFTPEQLSQGEEDKEVIVNIVKDINIAAENYSENIENAFDTIGILSVLTDIPVAMAINKISNKFKFSPLANKIAVIVACTAYPLALLMMSTSAKKEASRIGRFKQQQEILNNPELIMSYSDEQLKSVKDVKAPKTKKGFFESIASDFTFFKQYFKDKKEYKNFKENEGKHIEKLNDALKHVEVSEGQIKEAKNLQDKTFITFDKIDEMSQRYSEDAEASGEIAKRLTGTSFSMASLLTPLGIMLGLKRGMIPLRGIAHAVAKLTLDSKSPIFEFFNQANNIVKNDSKLNKAFSNIVYDKKSRLEILRSSKLRNLAIDFLHKNIKINDLINIFKDARSQKDFEKTITEIAQKHLKKGRVATWTRNVVTDSGRLYLDTQLAKQGHSRYKNMKFFETASAMFKNYNTLAKTIIYGGFVPLLAIPTGIGWLISSTLTDIQKKAGKIGIMKAMEEIDKPELFVKQN